jgi:hypothetical protein
LIPAPDRLLLASQFGIIAHRGKYKPIRMWE